jgi:hypothetical protein
MTETNGHAEKGRTREWSAIKDDERRIYWGDRLPPPDSTGYKLAVGLGYRVQSREVTPWVDTDPENVEPCRVTGGVPPQPGCSCRRCVAARLATREGGFEPTASLSPGSKPSPENRSYPSVGGSGYVQVEEDA